MGTRAHRIDCSPSLCVAPSSHSPFAAVIDVFAITVSSHIYRFFHERWAERFKGADSQSEVGRGAVGTATGGSLSSPATPPPAAQQRRAWNRPGDHAWALLQVTRVAIVVRSPLNVAPLRPKFFACQMNSLAPTPGPGVHSRCCLPEPNLHDLDVGHNATRVFVLLLLGENHPAGIVCVVIDYSSLQQGDGDAFPCSTAALLGTAQRSETAAGTEPGLTCRRLRDG
ncbi:unnamed protein product [Lampetra fluviatilis]